MNMEQNNLNQNNNVNVEGNNVITGPSVNDMNTLESNQNNVSSVLPVENNTPPNNDDNPKKRNNLLIIAIVIVVGVLIIGGILIVPHLLKKQNSENPNNHSGESQKYAYAIDYNAVNLDENYWNELNQEFKEMNWTNKDLFINKYTAQVLDQNSASIGGMLLMPLQPSYTIYYRGTDGGGASDISEYYLKISLNKDHIFYPNLISSIEGTSDNSFTFYLKDTDFNFNAVQPILRFHAKTTKEKNNNGYEIVYDEKNWEISKVNFNNEMMLYADYILDKEKSDFVEFAISINGILEDKQINELVQKLIQNIEISEITNNSIKNYLYSLRPNTYYVEMEQDQIKFNEKISLNTQNFKIRLWTSLDNYLLSPNNSSTGNVNVFQWYDKNWKNETDRINLYEYVNVNKDLEDIAKGYFSEDVDIEEYDFDALDLYAVYDNDNSYRLSNGYSDIVGFAFEIENNVYLIETTEYLYMEEETDFIDYLSTIINH